MNTEDHDRSQPPAVLWIALSAFVLLLLVGGYALYATLKPRAIVVETSNFRHTDPDSVRAEDTWKLVNAWAEGRPIDPAWTQEAPTETAVVGITTELDR